MKSRLDCLAENRRVQHRWRYGDDEAPETYPRPKSDASVLLIAVIFTLIGAGGLAWLLNNLHLQ